MRKRIEIKEELFKPLYEQGCNDNEIARRFGVTAGTIMRFRHNLGLPVVGTSTKIDEEVFKKLYSSRLDDRQIAQEMGLRIADIWRFRDKFGLPTLYTNS